MVSPLLANIALHGMENEIKKYARTLKGNKSKNESSLSLIRYADDFVILHPKKEVIFECKQIIERWLQDKKLIREERGEGKLSCLVLKTSQNGDVLA